MRKLIVIAVVLASLYGGYWVVGRSQIETRLTEALAQIDAGPQTLEYESLQTRGFPSRFDTSITDLVFVDPASGLRWNAPSFQLFALSYRPNEVIALFPGEQTFEIAGQVYTLTTQDMRASGKVSASTTLAFQNATITMDNPRLRTSNNQEVAMANLLAAMRLAPDTMQTYDTYVDARSIVLPEELRRLIDPANLQPPIVQNVKLDGSMRMSTPLALNSADATAAAIETLTIKEFAMAWGDMSLSVIGEVAPDESGLLDGSLTLSARNWRQAIDLGIANGAIDSDQRFLWTGIAENLDETPHVPDTLTLTIDVDDGMMMLGGLALGPAPVLR